MLSRCASSGASGIPARSAARADLAEAYREHGGRVLNFAYRFCGDRGLAEDLTQEAFTRLVREWQRGGRPRRLRAWLLAVTRNLALDHLARRGTATRGLPNVPQPSPPERPEARALRREAKDHLAIALAELPADQRAALILCVIEGLSYKEAAAICRCSVKALASRLNRARARLRERVAHLGEPSER